MVGRKRRRSVYYTITSMNDGTVLSARPIRKPAARIMKRDGDRLDDDNVCKEFSGSYVGSFSYDDEGRFRFFDIVANRLNMRRAVRELVLPRIEVVESELTALRNELAELRAFLVQNRNQE